MQKLEKAVEQKTGVPTYIMPGTCARQRQLVGASHFNHRETRRGFHTSLGRGDPCTQCQSQSCAQRTTLLSVGEGLVNHARP